MFGWRGEVFGAFACDSHFGGEQRVLLGAGDTVFWKYGCPFLKEIPQLARVSCARFFVAHRIDTHDRFFMEKIAHEREKCANDDGIRNGLIRTKRVELYGCLLRRRTTRRDVCMPEEERLSERWGEFGALALFQKTYDCLGRRIGSEIRKRFRIGRTLARTAARRRAQN